MHTDIASANLRDRLIRSVCQAGSAQMTPGLFRELLRLLSHGEPVTISQLAAAAAQTTEDAQSAVAGWSDTELD